MRCDGAGVTTDHPPTGPARATAGHNSTEHYEIRIRGHLGTRWASWFDGFTLRSEPHGITVLRGHVVDQAALHGLLQRLRDVGIPLVSLTPVPPNEPHTDGPNARPTEGN
jgi:hypothetical protein